MSEQELVPHIRLLMAGSESHDTLEFVLKQVRPRLAAYFRRHGFSDSDGDDLVQETFRRISTNIRSLRDAHCFMGWLFQIARNLARRAGTKVAEERDRGLNDAADEALTIKDPNPNPLSITLAREELDRIWQAVESLPGQQKECLVLQVVQEKSYEEIAQVMKLSMNTVRNHLRSARENLKRILDEGGGISHERPTIVRR
jgi:RNA polymerase sigma-70 factor, ECF subfamily